jgi:hypothetical protein
MICTGSIKKNEPSHQNEKMDKIGIPYYLKNNKYQKYQCPLCHGIKIRLLNGFLKKKVKRKVNKYV